MENLFVESEEIVYIEIIGDPVYDIYYDDNINFINDQLSRDVAVNQSQSMISREEVHVCSHSKPIEGVFVRSMEISGALSLYHNEYMKIKFQILVMSFAMVDVKIKLMVQKNYIIYLMDIIDGSFSGILRINGSLVLSYKASATSIGSPGVYVIYF
ncbi:hypothetical protein F2Q70_00005954 [Brassica cretica]|uniref:Uncharacterized protein n=1 Tax=Brassica cretica TaxID=69181 RepID=A0A8S9FSA7_BRACR|nr:hypothetical protein F2Q68_00022549 [Brassica cretica]KAF2576094.1 hypothetical protein F2Q70_00005954 [Brassica cretica]